MHKEGLDLIMRKSNFELLRVICILGILTMHAFGLFYHSATGFNLVYGVFINTLFNACVSIFVLISGYFGIKSSKEKNIYLELTLIFYSVLSYGIGYATDGVLDFKEVIKSFLPFSTGKYWYMTSYMLLLIFGDFINQIPEKMEKKNFQRLIYLMLFVFSILPTIVQAHVMDDGGKGFANMLLMYLIGRYMAIYPNEYFPKVNKGKIVCILLIIGFVLNYAVTWIGGNQGVKAPFARDCSIVIVLLSVAVFEMFKSMEFESGAINRIAKHVIGVYLLEAAIRNLFTKVFDFTQYVAEWYLPFLILAEVILIFMICIVTDILKEITLDKILRKMSGRTEDILDAIENKRQTKLKI